MVRTTRTSRRGDENCGSAVCLALLPQHDLADACAEQPALFFLLVAHCTFFLFRRASASAMGHLAFDGHTANLACHSLGLGWHSG